ncbi:hypothetical protein DFJ74DRAFT_744590 [Hyaloraphidium curvatum]|nr:hypothetical protein DFJ74DRAFT_744590 [Hyaloraphidium curvatum]
MRQRGAGPAGPSVEGTRDGAAPADDENSLRALTRAVVRVLQREGAAPYGDVVRCAAVELGRHGAQGPQGGQPGQPARDDKTLRRRVYDVLSVLAAVGAISRDGRTVVWRGMPSPNPAPPPPPPPAPSLPTADLAALVAEKRRALQRAREAHDLLRSLVTRNALRPSPDERARVHLPFVLLVCEKGTEVDIQTADNSHEVLFQFDGAFEVLDDAATLRMLNLPPPMDLPAPDLPHPSPAPPDPDPAPLDPDPGPHGFAHDPAELAALAAALDLDPFLNFGGLLGGDGMLFGGDEGLWAG